jgi:hypothetical protein
MSPHSANTVTALASVSPLIRPALVALTLALVACGDTVTIVECPPGTRPEGSECLPLDEPDTTLPDSTPDTDLPDSGLPDTSTDTSTDTVPSDTTSEVEVSTTRPTGSPCSRNADCQGGTCLDWTGGYCTLLDCDTAGCPTGETCLPLLGNSICVKDCPAGTCGSPDQQCKPLPTGSGLAPVCIAIDVGAGSTGQTCRDPTDCAGQAACLAAFPGGYCASLGCPDTACGAGSTCVRVDGVPSCLATCSTSADCDSEPGGERRCGVLSGVNNTPVDVCISGAEGKALGATCRTDFECGSGTCQVLGEGRCSQTQAPCFTSSVATDCNGAEFCQVTAESRVGICSQPCNAGRGCSGAAHCVTESKDPNQAWCRPSCSGSTDTSCNTVAGLTCAFGIPVSDSGQGRYACALSRAATPRATCNGDAQCPGGTCIKPSNSNGYCAPACGADDFCPFGGSCVTTASQRCMRACFSNTDCPSNFACGFTTGSPRDVCVP